jgi:hypothetical protein
MAIDIKAALQEFGHLKTQEQPRNNEYHLLRQAVKGNFRWPRDWPRHIPKVTQNLCKPITERFVTYLLGKGFSYNVDRPNTIEYRDAAERTEKILRRLLALSHSDIQFDMGGKTGSQLGRTIFKVYEKGKAGAKHACFVHCQPDYFYGIPASDDHLGDWAKVYYSYPVDKAEAERMFGPGDYKTEAELTREGHYDERPEMANDLGLMRARRVPVLEIWTKDDYALVVGGVVKYNDVNPNKWSDTGEGFIPFVVIENIRNSADNRGESDIGQARELNEHLNWLISKKSYIVQRWLTPTLVWEGAPQNYGEILAQTLGGGGAIPARVGSKLYFLAYDRPNPAVAELEATIRASLLETTGMSEIALQGTVQGSVNTGPALQAQFQPVLSSIEKKRKEWEQGLKLLFAMLLEVQEKIGDSEALGTAAINASNKSENFSDAEVTALSGKDIQGLRTVVLSWPGVLPKDDLEAARLEMEKASQGFQSIYTTLEKLGEEYPDDEIARIRMENQDPNLRGEKVAEQMRSQTPLIKAQMDQEMQMQQMAQGGAGAASPPPEDEEELPPEEGAMLQKLRAIQAGGPQFDMAEEEPVIEAAPPMAGAAY